MLFGVIRVVAEVAERAGPHVFLPIFVLPIGAVFFELSPSETGATDRSETLRIFEAASTTHATIRRRAVFRAADGGEEDKTGKEDGVELVSEGHVQSVWQRRRPPFNLKLGIWARPGRRIRVP